MVEMHLAPRIALVLVAGALAAGTALLAGCQSSGPPRGAPTVAEVSQPLPPPTPEKAFGEQREAQKEGNLQIGGGADAGR
jgi:hypothetical protein